MATKKTNKSSALVLAKPTRRKASGFDDAIEENATELDASPVQETGMARYSDAPQFDASDLFIPKLRIAQGLTAEVQAGTAKPGEWLVLGSDPMKSVTVIPMMMVRRRELRESGNDTRTVLCRSSDSITGTGTPGGECAVCPMNQWTKAKKAGGKNSAPQCTFIYSYIVYVADTGEVCVLEFYRTSIPTGKMLNTMILQKGLGKFAITLKSSSQQGPRGTYYQPTVAMAKATDKMLKEAMAKTAEMF